MRITDLVDFCQSHQVLHCVSLTPGEAAPLPSLVTVLASWLAQLQRPFSGLWPWSSAAVTPLQPSPPPRMPSVHRADPLPGRARLCGVCRSSVALAAEPLTRENPQTFLLTSDLQPWISNRPSALYPPHKLAHVLSSVFEVLPHPNFSFPR